MKAKAIWIVGLVALAAGYCVSRPDSARIAYISSDSTLAELVAAPAQARGTWATPLLVAPARSAIIGRGDARDVASAEAAVAAPGVAVVVGHSTSRGSLLAAPIYGEAGVPFIAPTATSRRLRDAGPWTFQLAPDDEAEGAFIARYALDSLGCRRITIYYLVADEYGIGLKNGIGRALAARSGAPADEVGILDDSDFERRVAASLRHATPDAVVIAARTPEAVAIARALRARRIAAPLILADGVDGGSFTRDAGSSAGRAYAVAWWDPGTPDPASRSFIERFRRIAGRAPRQQEAMYYDALMLAAQAAHEAGGSRDGIRRWLSTLGAERPAYRGITGPISFAPGRPTNLVMLRLDAAPEAAGPHAASGR